jgi:hypothetical protein
MAAGSIPALGQVVEKRPESVKGHRSRYVIQDRLQQHLIGF